MEYETNCTKINVLHWKHLMKGAIPTDYGNLVRLIKKDCPAMYKYLALDIPNPYASQCVETKTHYVLVHSMIEFFFRK